MCEGRSGLPLLPDLRERCRSLSSDGSVKTGQGFHGWCILIAAVLIMGPGNVLLAKQFINITDIIGWLPPVCHVPHRGGQSLYELRQGLQGLILMKVIKPGQTQIIHVVAVILIVGKQNVCFC